MLTAPEECIQYPRFLAAANFLHRAPIRGGGKQDFSGSNSSHEVAHVLFFCFPLQIQLRFVPSS